MNKKIIGILLGIGIGISVSSTVSATLDEKCLQDYDVCISNGIPFQICNREARICLDEY